MPALLEAARNTLERALRDPDQFAITPKRARCLAEMIGDPQAHTQRFVEELSFVPTGGQRWTRTLQVKIPTDAESTGATWWIVPLGPFARRRFPDLEVTDAAGQPIRLATRTQHGLALTRATLARPLHRIRRLDKQNHKRYRRELRRPEARSAYEDLKAELSAFFTDVSDTDNRLRRTTDIVEHYRELLHSLGFSIPAINEKRETLADTLVDLTDTTQYLCWVYARPGDTIHLRASHTIRDPKHKLQDGSISDLLSALWKGTVGLRRKTQEEREQQPDAKLPYLRRWLRRSPLTIDREVRRERQANWFRQFGLAPINYAFNVPTYRYTASYYATLTPPDNTTMTYVDWEVDSSFNDGEVDCAHQSIHVYNAPEALGRAKTYRTTRAYIRCAPHHHKQILIAAALNFAVVLLVLNGRLTNISSSILQGFVVASPSVWVASLAQQQRHYYAHALRRSRAILWAYLLLGLIFLIVIAVAPQVGHAPPAGASLELRVAALALAVASCGVFVWHAPLGHGYERVIHYLREQRRYALEDPARLGMWCALANDLWWRRGSQREVSEIWQCYEAAYEGYSRLIWKLAAVVMVGCILLFHFWWSIP